MLYTTVCPLPLLGVPSPDNQVVPVDRLETSHMGGRFHMQPLDGGGILTVLLHRIGNILLLPILVIYYYDLNKNLASEDTVGPFTLNIKTYKKISLTEYMRFTVGCAALYM